MASFQPGDVVMLRSGGPYMTVSALGDQESGHLDCKWFDGPILYTNVFHPATLKAVQEPVAAPNDPED